jgi:Mn2+/Fe2+ NRAMP family transporter
MDTRKLLSILGPGLLYAGAAIGVSHLVQSTRAGAGFGLDLVWVLVVVNLIKYPFFEFAPRYAAASGESLIAGYRRLGMWAIIAFGILTIATMFTIQAAITIVTAGIFANTFGLSVGVVPLSAIILATTVLVLVIGKYAFLDKLIKAVIILLALSTMAAVIYALGKTQQPASWFTGHFNWGRDADLFFLIAFIGWMPAPIDVSVWSSLWNIEKAKSLGYKPEMRDSLLDFRIGYIGTTILALCFLLLGALVMKGSGNELSQDGSTFAGQLISMYTQSIGAWSGPLIALAALTTMFSTTLTCLDAYPRVLQPTTDYLFPKLTSGIKNKEVLYWFWIVTVMAGVLALLQFFARSMHFMVDVATTLSFVTAPALAIMNYKVVTGKFMPLRQKPGSALRLWAMAGIIFLSLFTLFYIAWIAKLV